MYFPISGATIDPFYLIGLGFIIGIFGGFFGVGGSFLAGPALFVELQEEGLQRFGTSVSAILEHLSQCGYEPYWLARAGPHRKTNPAEIHARAARNGYVDVLFLKQA